LVNETPTAKVFHASKQPQLVPHADLSLPWIFAPSSYCAANLLLLDIDESSSFKTFLDKWTNIKGHTGFVAGFQQAIAPLLVRVFWPKVDIE
jgi:hypothetical protein